jgi:hypothetical protein
MSKNLGVPVSMSQCFWCGEMKNEILIGRRLTPNADKAPRSVVHSYEPCDKCQAGMNQGITLIEANDHPRDDRQLAMGGAYPTGRWIVVREQALDHIVNDPNLLETIKQHRKTFLEPQAFQRLLPEEPVNT